jgi:hypothetical protein
LLKSTAMKKIHFLPLLGLVLAARIHAAAPVYEPFDYPAAQNLATLTGGSGWSGGWTVDGQSCKVSSGLSYTDVAGNLLDVVGLAADTSGSATTRNFRLIAGGPQTDVWISFLYQLPASNSKFEGLTFYRGTAALFSVSSSSIDPTAGISLGNSVAGGSVFSAKGVFGRTHLIVLHLTEAGGTNGADQVEMFIDPLLTEIPSLPDGTVLAADFDFDTVRIAGQDGSRLLIDEIRIGGTFADVSPHTTGSSPDSDGDGLTDEQETVLGLDPFSSDTELIAAIQSHPEYFDLYDTAGILALGRGGVVLPQEGTAPVSFTFELQHSGDLISWPVLETFTRAVTLPAGKNFLRVTLENP